MTRKHFEALAEKLNFVRPNVGQGSMYSPHDQRVRRGMWDVVVSEIAHTCERHNPRFDRKKFIDACNKE